MHWTAFLAYRRFPATARVADDMACIGCGYNLRGLNVWRRCPECGQEVGNSVFLLAQPDIVHRSLSSAGVTYFAPLALLLTCVSSAWWSALVAGGALGIAAVFRAVALWHMRFRGALARLPVVGNRLNAWWIIALAELFVALAIIAVVLSVSALAPTTAAGAGPVVGWLLVVAWLLAMLSALAAGRFGYALVDMLGFAWTRIEFRVQNAAAVLGLVLCAALLAVVRVVPTPTAQMILLGAIGLITLIVTTMTGVALLHASTAALHAQESVDDVLDSERVLIEPERPPLPHDQQPSISLVAQARGAGSSGRSPETD